MTGDYRAIVSERMKHLEMIQVVVARLANEAALIKGWALTISSAFFAYAAQAHSPRVAEVGLLPVLAFWGLNAYYLRAERRYRKLYDRVRSLDTSVEVFSMDASKEDVDSWLKTMFTPVLSAFYSIPFILGLILIFQGRCRA